MTTASIDRCYEHYIIEVCGHAGFAEESPDPVCAAVSALAFTLDAWLTEGYAGGALRSLEKSCGDGAMYFDAVPRDEALFEAGLAVITQGLELLSEKWPDNVSLEY